MLEVLEGLEDIAPLNFFALEIQAKKFETPPLLNELKKKYMLPATAGWLSENAFASVALAWGREGIVVGLFVEKPFEEASYPRYEAGDAFELFLDTRDLKSAGFATKFCHHFLFLPQPVQEVVAQELTHFRSEDSHPLCDPVELDVQTTFEKGGYQMRIFIPAHCLHGYDPQVFQRLGFTYRIHRYKGKPQYFSVEDEYFSISQNPRLWASVILKGKGS